MRWPLSIYIPVCPTKTVKKKISIATAFCPLPSFIRAPHTKKKKRPRKKIKQSETETPPFRIAQHCKDKQIRKIFSRRYRKEGIKTKVKIEPSQISLKFKVNNI